jgi:hypothetical protein
MPAKKAKQEEESGTIVAVAKTIGKAAGKIASLAGVHAEQPGTVDGKFVKKNKSRLPRKQKKAARKSGATTPMM